MQRGEIGRHLRKYAAKTIRESAARVSENPTFYSNTTFNQLYLAMHALEETWNKLDAAIKNDIAMILNPLAYELFTYYDLVSHSIYEVFFIHENENGNIPIDVENELSSVATRRDVIYTAAREALIGYIRQHPVPRERR